MTGFPELGPARPEEVRELLYDLTMLLNALGSRVDQMAGYGSLAVQNLGRAAHHDLTTAVARINHFVTAHPAPEELPLGEMARRVLRDW